MITHFILFKNKYKKEERHPDWRIRAKDENGNYQDVGAGWVKTENGEERISCRFDINPAPVKEKFVSNLTPEESETLRIAREREIESRNEIVPDDIPF